MIAHPVQLLPLIPLIVQTLNSRFSPALGRLVGHPFGRLVGQPLLLLLMVLRLPARQL